jgi:HEPN domain-containing protein
MASAPLFRSDFRELAELRLKDAKVLLDEGQEQAGYYLCGYAVECALKACIAKKTRKYQFPPKKSDRVYTHSLNELLKTAGLEGQLELEAKANLAFAANWNTVRDWNEEVRYQLTGLDGADLYKAVTGADGILQWIKKHW